MNEIKKKSFQNQFNFHANKHMVVCKICEKEMILEEETVFFDRNWFHKPCWDVKNSSTSMRCREN